MRVLVTGAAGRLARHLVPALYARGFELTLLDKSGESVRESLKHAKELSLEKIRIVEADLVSAPESVLRDACVGCDAVVHLAALLDYNASREQFFKVNVSATKRLLNAANAVGSVKRFVFVSSTSVYGQKSSENALSESSGFAPTDAYGESKLAAEQVVRESGLPFVILRPSVIYGIGFTEGFFQIISGIKSGKLKLVGDGENKIAFVHVDDVVQAILLALEKKEALGEDFIVSGEAVSQKQAFDAVADVLGVPRAEKRVPKWFAYLTAEIEKIKARLLGRKPKLTRENVATICENRFFDCLKAKRVLGFKPRVSFEDGVSEVVSALARALNHTLSRAGAS